MGECKYKKPILLNYAVERGHNGTRKIFHYDYDRDINVLDVNSQVPFIEAGHEASLLTVTKSDREFDCDDERGFSELYTKTDENRELDDEENSYCDMTASMGKSNEPGNRMINVLTELYTKTEETREQDDDEPDSPPWLNFRNYLELVSKTFADRERDDEEDDFLRSIASPQRSVKMDAL